MDRTRAVACLFEPCGALNVNFIAIDFETTASDGIHPNEPWQLGVAVVRDGAIAGMCEWFFRTERDFPTPRGSSAEFPLTFMDQWEEISDTLLAQRLVAHNLACEKTLLTRFAPLTKWGPWVDTLKLARARYPGLPGYTLGELCAMFGCVPELAGRTWHDGLYDAVACANLALRLAGVHF